VLKSTVGIFLILCAPLFATERVCDEAEVRTLAQAKSAAELGDFDRSSSIISRLSEKCLMSKEAAPSVVDVYARQCQFRPESSSGLHILQFLYFSRAHPRYCQEAFEYLSQVKFDLMSSGVSQAQLAAIALGFASNQLEKAERLGQSEFCIPGLVEDEWIKNLYLALHKYVAAGAGNVPRYENFHLIARQLISYLEPADPLSLQLVRLRGFLNSPSFGVGTCSKYVPAECCPNLR